jgi:predicted transcriptional regulator
MRKILTTLFMSSMALLALNIGEVPSQVVISDKNGGYLDGTAWNSSMLKNKLYVVFYVDPDERDTNSAFIKALKDKNYDLNYFGSVAIINLAATWLPNVVLEAKLKDKQKKFPNTIYVKDKSKVLVKEWNLQDDSSNVLVFNKSGELIYSYAGKLSSSEITKVISLIDRNLI